MKELLEALKKDFEEFKKTNDELLAKKTHGIVDSYLENKLEKINEAMAAKETRIEEIQSQVDETQAMAKRQFENGTDEHQSKEKARTQREAFGAYLKGGENRLTPEQKHAMSALDDPKGGYFVIPQMASDITMKVRETSPIRPLATIVTLQNSDQYEKPQEGDLAGAEWEEREAAHSETPTPTYNMLRIRARGIRAMPKIPINLVEDAGIDIVGMLQDSVAKTFSLMENTSFVTGDGDGVPRGFLTYPAGTGEGQIQQVVNGHATVLASDPLIDLVYSMKDQYRANGAFLMNRTTQGVVRKLKDGDGNYLWQPSAQAGQPPTLHGYPVFMFADMPDIASGTLPIAFADLKSGYLIVDRLGISVQVNPYKEPGFILYPTRKRVGGGVDQTEAIKILVMST